MGHRIIDTTWETLLLFATSFAGTVLTLFAMYAAFEMVFQEPAPAPAPAYHCTLDFGSQRIPLAHLHAILDDCGNHARVIGGTIVVPPAGKN